MTTSSFPLPAFASLHLGALACWFFPVHEHDLRLYHFSPDGVYRAVFTFWEDGDGWWKTNGSGAVVPAEVTAESAREPGRLRASTGMVRTYASVDGSGVWQVLNRRFEEFGGCRFLSASSIIFWIQQQARYCQRSIVLSRLKVMEFSVRRGA